VLPKVLGARLLAEPHLKNEMKWGAGERVMGARVSQEGTMTWWARGLQVLTKEWLPSAMEYFMGSHSSKMRGQWK